MLKVIEVIAKKYLRRPATWPWILRVALRYVYRGLAPGSRKRREQFLAAERAKAERWCAERSVSTEELIHTLGIEKACLDVEAEFSKIFGEARTRGARYPAQADFTVAANLNLLYALAREGSVQRIIETGVAFGWSSLVLLLAIRDRRDARLYSIDLPYLKSVELDDSWVGAAVPSTLQRQWKFFRMADRQGLPKALRAAGRVDLVHYDSDKTPEGRAFAYNAIWPFLVKGGILVSDDVGDNLAFKCFAARVGQEPHIISYKHKFQGILIKG